MDIEISFESQDEDSKQDRIDILLFNKKSKTLRFVEAKHFSNKEIWSDSTPKVIKQLKKYEGQIANCRCNILSAYSQYVQIVNGIFGYDLPIPLSIDEKVTLLTFDFDRDQQNGRMKNLITDKSEYCGVQLYAIGNIDKIVPENLWSQAKIL